ncbi:MAG TPA: FecR domain-containing protein, partial [Methylomirabilota bacterium]|nr:FecR domain-containing protein [Methylomirabilota bacterium]
TVRELSVLTITEDLGRTTINLESGKIAVSVAKQRMQPGEKLEVHTPNAVAAVRGTVFVVEVSRQGAQTGGGNLGATTQVTSVTGSVEVSPANNPANAALLTAFKSVGLLGPNLGQVRTLTQPEMNQLLSGFAASAKFGFHQATWQAMSLKEQNKLVALAASLLTDDPRSDNKSPLNLPSIVPQTGPAEPKANAPVAKIVNGGFETGLFPPGWNLSGTGAVLSTFGSFTPPAGQFMGFLSTGPGSAPDPTGRFSQFSSLSQPFQVTGGTLYTIKATYNFVSNEYPYWVGLYGGNSPFNDTFDIRVKGPGGQVSQLATETVNTAFTPGQVSQQVVGAAGFTAGGGCPTCGWGFTGFKQVAFSWLAPESGIASLLFEVGDVADSNYSSGVLIDSVSIPEDPPLYLVQGGKTLARASLDPLVEYTGGSAIFDSAMIVASGSSVSLAGPLLRATAANLTVPVSLLSVLPGGRFISSTDEPLVKITGGTHALGTDVAMFDLAGRGTAVDVDSGRLLATDTPLSTGGSLFEADGATVTTRQALRVDTALLEATAPLLHLKHGSVLTSAADAITLSGTSRLTAGSTLVAVDASRLAVAMGALVNVAGGSVLNVTGDLLSLRNGSSVSLLNGPLLSVSGGSLASIGGGLVAFGGSGGNLLSVSNSLCGGSCLLIGGIPVALLNGATAGNVSIGAGAIQNPGLGSIKLASPSTALLSVSGAASKVTIGPK